MQKKVMIRTAHIV